MNKVFAIIFFPVFFIIGYLHRIIVYDILQGLFVDLPKAFYNSFIGGLIFGILFPITVVLDIFIGFLVELIVAGSVCEAVFRGVINFKTAFEEILRDKRKKHF